MNKVLLVLGFSLLLMVYGVSEADSISSSIVCDGATLIASSVIGEAQTYAASLFTTDYATIEREFTVGKTISTLLSGESEGPMVLMSTQDRTSLPLILIRGVFSLDQ